MKTATANLENDHVHILRLIEVMELIAGQDYPNTEHLEKIVGLIRNFADGLHHKKEENLLFPKMVEKGFSFNQGPIAVMMNDHVQGRNFVKAMAHNIALYKAGDKKSLTELYRSMKGYSELLRAHIGKENNILFRLADNALSEEEQRTLLNEFQSLANDQSSDYIIQIDTLAGFYNIGNQ